MHKIKVTSIGPDKTFEPRKPKKGDRVEIAIGTRHYSGEIQSFESYSDGYYIEFKNQYGNWCSYKPADGRAEFTFYAVEANFSE